MDEADAPGERQERQDRQRRQEPGEDADRLARIAVDAGLKVHKVLGPGLLESVYEQCLHHELTSRGLRSNRQVMLPVEYGGVTLTSGYRLDLVVENTIAIEMKATETLTRLHEAQLLTYLKLSRYPIGLLMNFNVVLFKQALRRFVCSS